MSSIDIKHFLVIYDVSRGEAEVEEFGTDYDRAQEAYAEAERGNRDREDVDIVLLSADSLETIKRTHSSYFAARDELKRELLSA